MRGGTKSFEVLIGPPVTIIQDPTTTTVGLSTLHKQNNHLITQSIQAILYAIVTVVSISIVCRVLFTRYSCWRCPSMMSSLLSSCKRCTRVVSGSCRQLVWEAGSFHPSHRLPITVGRNCGVAGLGRSRDSLGKVAFPTDMVS